MSTIGRKRALEHVVEDTSSCEPPKVAKFTGPIAYRKNIVKLAEDKPEEFKRFCIAIARMQRNSERGVQRMIGGTCAHFMQDPFVMKLRAACDPRTDNTSSIMDQSSKRMKLPTGIGKPPDFVLITFQRSLFGIDLT